MKIKIMKKNIEIENYLKLLKMGGAVTN